MNTQTQEGVVTMERNIEIDKRNERETIEYCWDVYERYIKNNPNPNPLEIP